MGGKSAVLAIDQGTTSSRALVFDGEGRILGLAQKELPQHFPQSGWVEHDAEDIWRDTVETVKGALDDAGLEAGEIAALGITNQRETTILWDRESGEALHRAIVWQDRRTAELCRDWKAEGWEPEIQKKTGLLLDPYFSGSKLAWLLNEIPGAREKAEAGKLAFGTVDCFLLWRLTGGRVHATDATNASRTLLYDIHKGDWDDDLLARFGIPRALLPEVRDCMGAFGATEKDLFGAALPILGIAGDQQAAAIGQACLKPGMVKSTYGTGCFALYNTGGEALASTHRLLTTVATQFGGKRSYALEGSIFVAGAAVQWLRDALGLIASAGETEALARQAKRDHGVVLVPAFVGLGAPHWDADARGALFGMSRDTGRAEIVRAALEAVCFQTRDLLEAMVADGATAPSALRVDGGMVVNDWMLQFLADSLGVAVERPEVTETTALGAAFLAAAEAGVLSGIEAISETWRAEARFEPKMPEDERARRYAAWRDAVERVKSAP
ncbi:MAG: glycerol kinase GlpK [Rhodovibrionaceae bacterium]